jgi:hypothetical protein
MNSNENQISNSSNNKIFTENEEIQRNVLFVLNKVSSPNFNKMLTTMLEILHKINNTDEFEIVVKIIHNKVDIKLIKLFFF